jgi:hypothetical protein
MTGEKRGFMPQAEVMGPLRNTHHQLNRNGTPEVVYTPRRSRVIMGVNRFGDIIFIPLPGSRWDKVDPALLPHFWRGTEQLFDQNAHSYKTSLHRKTTTVSLDISRGDGSHRPEKKTGFMFSRTVKDIARERKDKELKRRLLLMGIDVNKLYLLLHSATHNQTQLEQYAPKKKKKNIVSKAIKARGGNEKFKMDKNLAVSSPFMTHEKRVKGKKTIARNVYSYEG